MSIDRKKVLARAMAIGKANAAAKKKKDSYSRVANSPYPRDSAEDRKLSADAKSFSARNRANLGQGVKDVVTGRAAVEGVRVLASGAAKGAKAVYNATVGNALKVDDRHQRIIGNDKEKFRKDTKGNPTRVKRRGGPKNY